MSLILDALKRAERERRADPAAGVEVPTLAAPPRRRWWLRIFVGLVLALVLLVVIAVAVRMLRGKAGAVPARQAPAARTLAPKPQPQIPARAPPQTGNLVTPQAPPAPPPKAIPGTESLSSLDELAEPEPAAPPVVSSPLPSRAPAPKPAAPAATKESAPAAEPAPADDATGKSEPQPVPEREVPAALTQPAPLRKLREMPPEYRADFPALNVQVHVYEKEAPARFVIVNDRRYHEGENLAEGPKLVEIVRDGMVLEYRGEKLLYTLNR